MTRSASYAGRLARARDISNMGRGASGGAAVGDGGRDAYGVRMSPDAAAVTSRGSAGRRTPSASPTLLSGDNRLASPSEMGRVPSFRVHVRNAELRGRGDRVVGQQALAPAMSLSTTASSSPAAVSRHAAGTLTGIRLPASTSSTTVTVAATSASRVSPRGSASRSDRKAGGIEAPSSPAAATRSTDKSAASARESEKTDLQLAVERAEGRVAVLAGLDATAVESVASDEAADDDGRSQMSDSVYEAPVTPLLQRQPSAMADAALSAGFRRPSMVLSAAAAAAAVASLRAGGSGGGSTDNDGDDSDGDGDDGDDNGSRADRARGSPTSSMSSSWAECSGGADPMSQVAVARPPTPRRREGALRILCRVGGRPQEAWAFVRAPTIEQRSTTAVQHRGKPHGQRIVGGVTAAGLARAVHQAIQAVTGVVDTSLARFDVLEVDGVVLGAATDIEADSSGAALARLRAILKDGSRVRLLGVAGGGVTSGGRARKGASRTSRDHSPLSTASMADSTSPDTDAGKPSPPQAHSGVGGIAGRVGTRRETAALRSPGVSTVPGVGFSRGVGFAGLGIGLGEASGAPTLKRSGFATEPALSELRAMGADELAAVRDFAVSRRGVGRIVWPGETDVRGLDLDAIVDIEEGEVALYDGVPASQQPPRGHGLNKRAHVELWGVVPDDDDAGSGEESGHGSRLVQFSSELREHTNAMPHAAFDSYDEVSGTWRFTVEHAGI